MSRITPQRNMPTITTLPHPLELGLDGESGAPIYGFMFNGVLITDPTQSECSRFDVDPQAAYGVPVEGAQELLALNAALRRAGSDAVPAGMAALFEGYISDGPGYAGPVEVRLIDGLCLVTTRAGGEADTSMAWMGAGLGSIAGVGPMLEQDREALFAALSDDSQQYVGDPSGLDPQRVRTVVFADGRRGAVLLWGEPQFVSIAVLGDATAEHEAEVRETWPPSETI